MIRITRRKKAGSLIPISSMADIAFLLLIFFLLSGIADMEKEIPLRIPRTGKPWTQEGKHFNIFITADNRYFFDSRYRSPQELEDYARYRLSIHPEIRAVIHADKGLPYHRVNIVLETLKEAGLYNIVFASRKAKQ